MTATAPCPVCGSRRSRPMAQGCRDYEYGVPYAAGYILCPDCGLARLSPLPNLDDLARFYPPDYANYAAPASRLSRLLMAAYDSGVRRQALRLAPPGSRVLDVGCGGGHYLDRLQGLGLDLHGTEFSDEAARPARAKGHTVHVGELERLDLPDGHFRLIRLNHVIEHVLAPLATLATVRRLLAPGGTVVIETPNRDCLDSRLFGRYWGALHFPRHIHLFTPKSLRLAAAQTGLCVTRTVFTVMPTGWSLGLQNLLTDLTGLKVSHGRCALYPYFMLGCLPLAALHKAIGGGTMMQAHLAALEDEPCSRANT